jgi:hypothetical protein
MHQFYIGSGDYTRDRDEILGNPTIEEIVARIKERRISQVEEIFISIEEGRQQQEKGKK